MSKDAPNTPAPGAEQSRLERIAAHYGDEEARLERRANLYAARRAAEQVGGPDVLVCGAGTGAWTDTLLEKLERFDTVDAVAGLVEALVSRHPERITGHVSLFEAFSPPHPYDTVVMGHVLEHVADPVAVLARARRWLKPGGRVVILVPNADSIHRLVGVELGFLDEPAAFTPADELLGHRRVYNPESLRRDCEDAGLICQELTGLILKPLSNTQMDAWDDALQDAFFALGDRCPHLACVLFCVAEPSGDR